MKLPSLDNQNPRTWKCKLFGCRDETYPVILHDNGEKHGIGGGWSFATATTTLLTFIFRGCHWCSNYRKLLVEEEDCWPKWFCDCEVCVSANQHRKWLYEPVAK